MAEKPTIAEATGSAAGAGPRGKEIEQAMADAVTKAMAEGITDPEEIKKRQLEARAKLTGRQPPK